MWAAENRCGDTKGDPADGEVDRAGMGMACSFLPVLLRRRVPGCARRNPFRCTIGDIGSTGVLLLCRDERLSEGACVSDPGEPCWRAAAVVREKCIALLRWLRLRGWPGDNIAAESAQELSNGQLMHATLVAKPLHKVAARVTPHCGCCGCKAVRLLVCEQQQQVLVLMRCATSINQHCSNCLGNPDSTLR